MHGEADVARWRVALEERLQAVELLLRLGVRYVGLDRAGVGLRAERARASGASSARVGPGGRGFGWVVRAHHLERLHVGLDGGVGLVDLQCF